MIFSIHHRAFSLKTTFLIALCVAFVSPVCAAAADSTALTPPVFDSPVFPSPEFILSFPSTGQIAVLNPATASFSAIYNLGIAPGTILVNPSRPIIYVFDVGSPTIVAFQTEDPRIIGVIHLPAPVSSMTINPSGSRIYAISGASILVISTQTMSVVTTIQLPSDGAGIAIADHLHRLFVTLPSIDRIAIIDLPSNMIEKEIYPGSCSEEPCVLGDMFSPPGEQYIFALSSVRSTVIVMDARSGHIIGKTTFRKPGAFKFTGFNPASNEVWVIVLEREGTKNFAVSTRPPFGPALGGQFGGPVDALAFNPSGQGFAAVDTSRRIHSNELTESPGLVELPSGSRTLLLVNANDIVFEP